MWRDDRSGGTEARYAFFRVIETFEQPRPPRQGARSSGRSTTGRPRSIRRRHVARWDLHGLLTSVGDADLDRDPGGGEWTIRQTLAHTVYVERAYPAWSAWWLGREQTDELPASAPDEVGEGFPDESDEGAGSLSDIGARLDAAMDGAAERMATLDDAQLAAPARWSGYAVDVGFRLWRQSSHLQEHTVQVEKTLVMLGRAPARGAAPGAARLARVRDGSRRWSTPFRRHSPSRVASAFEEAVAAVGDVAAHVRAPGAVVVSDED